MKLLLFGLVFFLPFASDAQHKRMKKKVSYGEGTLFIHAGFNRAGFSSSNVRFQGPGYDFTLQGVLASDGGLDFSLPPISASIGYYIRDHWAVSLGIDRMRYILSESNAVNLSGTIDEDLGSNWSGTYSAEPVVTQRDSFYYTNAGGLNYLRLGLTRTDMLVKLGSPESFAVSSNAGISIGPILTSNDFNFAGLETARTSAISGYGLAAHLGIRLEFFRTIYLQSTFSGGYHHQLKVHTRPNDPSSFARQMYGFIMWDNAIGVLLYIRPTNSCDSCPVW